MYVHLHVHVSPLSDTVEVHRHRHHNNCVQSVGPHPSLINHGHFHSNAYILPQDLEGDQEIGGSR